MRLLKNLVKKLNEKYGYKGWTIGFLGTEYQVCTYEGTGKYGKLLLRGRTQRQLLAQLV